MKTNELRIGNLISDHFFTYKVAEIEFGIAKGFSTLDGKNIYPDSLYSLNEDNLRGIPLTEEWLLKLGFEQKPEGEPLYYKDRIMVNMGNHNIVHILGTNNGHVLPRQIGGFYIHQLQNLYFALTGEELTIKL